tara:strand:- start:225 stop:4706 length:4482 start_codon:yes stop_codon:yes gene_type:complete
MRQGVELGQALNQVGLDPALGEELQLRIDQVGKLNALLGSVDGRTPAHLAGVDSYNPGVLETLRIDLEGLLAQGSTLKEAISSEELALPSTLEATLLARIAQADNLKLVLNNLTSDPSPWSGTGDPRSQDTLDILERDISNLMYLGVGLQQALSSEHLEINSDLASEISVRMNEADILHMTLTGLDVDDGLKNSITEHMILTGRLSNALDNLGTSLDPTLRKEIEWQTEEVKALGIALKSIPGLFEEALYGTPVPTRPGSASFDREGGLANMISLAWEDFGSLSDALDSMQIGFKEDIEKHVGMLTPLVTTVQSLGIPAEFSGQIYKALIDTQSIDAAIDSLDLTEFTNRIEEVSAYISGGRVGATQYPGLVELVSTLGDADASPLLAINALKSSVLTTYNNVNALDLIFDSLPEVPTDLLDDIQEVMVMMSGLDIGPFHQAGLTDMLGDLQVPPDLIKHITTEFGRVRVLGDALMGMELPTEFFGDISKAVIAGDDLSKALESLGVLSDAEINGSFNEFGAWNPGIAKEIQDNINSISALETLLGRIQVPSALSDQIMGIASIIGGVDPDTGELEDGLLKALEDLGIDSTRVNELKGARDTLQELNEILSTVKLPPEVARAISVAFTQGESLEQIITRLSTPSEGTDTTISEDVAAVIRTAFDNATGLEGRLNSINSLAISLEEDQEFSKDLTRIDTMLTNMGKSIGGILGALSDDSLGGIKSTVEGVEEVITGLEETTETVVSNVTGDLVSLEGKVAELNELIQKFAQDQWVPSAELTKLLDRPSLTELETLVRDELKDIMVAMDYDPATQKEALTKQINLNFHESAIQLARQFGIDPSQLKSGTAQQHFELLEVERNSSLYQMEMDVQSRMDEVWINAINSFTGTLGTIAGATIDKDRLSESVKQFASDLELRLLSLGMDEEMATATISKINNEILNNTRRLSMEIGINWATITGEAGLGPGELDFDVLGIDPNMFEITTANTGEFPGLAQYVGSTAPTLDAYIKMFPNKVQTLRDGFEAMTAEIPTDEQLMSIIRGEKVQVASMPTLEARTAGAEIMLQNMERMSKYDAIASTYELDFEKFNAAQKEADLSWKATILDVVGMLGFDQIDGHEITSEAFRLAKNELDGFTNAIYFNNQLTPAQRETAIADYLAVVIEKHFSPKYAADFIRANDQFDRLYGDMERQIAMSFEMETENFHIASRQVELEEARLASAWGALWAHDGSLLNKVPVGLSNYGHNWEKNPGNVNTKWGPKDQPYPITASLFQQSSTDRNDPSKLEYTPDFMRIKTRIWDVVMAGMAEDTSFDEITDNIEYDGAAKELAYKEKFFKGGNEYGMMQYFFNVASHDEIRNTQADFEWLIGGAYTFDDNQLRDTVRSLFEHMNGETPNYTNEHTITNAIVPSEFDRRPTLFNIYATDRNWWSNMESDERTAIMQLLSGAGFTPERDKGGSWLNSVGNIIGHGVGVAAGVYVDRKMSQTSPVGDTTKPTVE